MTDEIINEYHNKYLECEKKKIEILESLGLERYKVAISDIQIINHNWRSSSKLLLNMDTRVIVFKDNKTTITNLYYLGTHQNYYIFLSWDTRILYIFPTSKRRGIYQKENVKKLMGLR